jgi:uncharacterized protein (TIGR03435 family)
MPAQPRETRRAEIESDLWESQRHASRDHGRESARHILLRLVMGIPDDLAWRVEQEAAAGRLAQENIVLWARVAGAALFICAFWLIDADASRRRTTPAFAHPAVLDRRIEGITTMRNGDGSRRGTQFDLLAAGVAATVGLTMLPQLAAQAPPPPVSGPAFEAASVKPNRSGDLRARLDPQPGGRLTATNVPAAELIRFAYDRPDFQVVGGPKWLNSDRFDVVAKAEGDPTLAEKRLMLRRLLAERFKLTAHTEMRELPIYALVIARSDGRTGPRLRRTAADCARVEPTGADVVGIGPSPSDGPAACGFFGFAPGTDFPSGRGGLAFRGLTMAAVAKRFVPILRRSVIDHTGLAGYFDAEFDFIAELPLPPPPPGVPNPFVEPFVSVFTVLPEQLGLKFESKRGAVEVLVIDSAEPPTPD